MSVPPEILRGIRQWIERAEDDLRNAEHTLRLKENCPLWTVCFHAQQCAEKYLKGLLILRSIDFPKTHDLVVLLNLAGGPQAVGVDLLDVEPLNRYPVEARYPGDWDPVDRGEAEQSVGMARKVREVVRRHFPEAALNG